MKQLKRKYFTLLELSAVIVIFILLTAISGSYIGRERKSAVFERALRDFRVYCARARADSMLDGKVRRLLYYPDEKVFRIEKSDEWLNNPAVMQADEIEGEGDLPPVILDAVDKEWEAEQEFADGQAGENSSGSKDESIPEWRFPEKLDITIELPAMEGVEPAEDFIELWRFTRGGSARMSYALTVQLGSDVRSVRISDFTGWVEVVAEASDNGRIIW
ncbi:MAG: type II secretion system protein [Lentisphaeria bacterium]|nr:type II secretion system protein [Lentisphaeria bacterium]